MDNLINFFQKENIENLLGYLDDTRYLYGAFAVIFLIVFVIMSLALKKNTKNIVEKKELKTPSLDEIVDTRNIKVSDDNEFVDVLVAIEEEMTAIRELYVGGYISKGVYISETDRLYEKAKIFGV